MDRNWSILIYHFLNCIFDFVEESFQESLGLQGFV